VTIDWDGAELEASVFTDLVEPVHGGVREAVYTSDYYAGSGALVSKAVGRGRAYYYGTAFNEASARVFLEKLGAAEPWKHAVELPESCELAVREKDGRAYAFILNYRREPASVVFHQEAFSLLDDRALGGAVEIPAYGVMVVRM